MSEPMAQQTHDVVSTSIRRLYDVSDVVQMLYRRQNNVVSLLGFFLQMIMQYFRLFFETNMFSKVKNIQFLCLTCSRASLTRAVSALIPLVPRLTHASHAQHTLIHLMSRSSLLQLNNEVKNDFGKKKFRKNGRSILLIMTRNLIRILLFIKLISLTYLIYH